jgi:diguanylate cyclase (GGDEF)-like protein
MRHHIIRLGRVRTVAVITLVSTLFSVTLTAVLMLALDMDITPQPLAISVLVPLIVASSVSWGVVEVLFRVHRLEEEIRHVATYDMLTGVMTRRAFFNAAESVLRVAGRNRTPVSALSIDIDDFKRINDGYGHSAGDAVLSAFGTALRQCARKSDIVGRIGGEEFSLLLPDTELAGAINLAGKIQAALPHENVCTGKGVIRFAVSIGIAHTAGDGSMTLEALLRQSDLALYQAKRSGKNKINVYPAGDPDLQPATA